MASVISLVICKRCAEVWVLLMTSSHTTCPEFRFSEQKVFTVFIQIKERRESEIAATNSYFHLEFISTSLLCSSPLLHLQLSIPSSSQQFSPCPQTRRPSCRFFTAASVAQTPSSTLSWPGWTTDSSCCGSASAAWVATSCLLCGTWSFTITP